MAVRSSRLLPLYRGRDGEENRHERMNFHLSQIEKISRASYRGKRLNLKKNIYYLRRGAAGIR